MDQRRATRKNGKHLRVPVLPEEETAIKKNAAQSGLTVATFLRNIGIGYEVRGIVDNQQVLKMLAINGDLGRLGGLIKLWLTNDERVAMVGTTTLLKVLARIETNQQALYEISKTVLKIRD
jgi:hypothetical protein